MHSQVSIDASEYNYRYENPMSAAGSYFEGETYGLRIPYGLSLNGRGRNVARSAGKGERARG